MIRISIAESGKSPQLLTFNASAITLGRAPGHELPLHGKGVSSTHCRIVREGDAYFIEDLGSTNGTYVNRQKVQGRRPIGPTDDVVLAVYRLRVLGDNESGASIGPPAGPAGPVSGYPSAPGGYPSSAGGYPSVPGGHGAPSSPSNAPRVPLSGYPPAGPLPGTPPPGSSPSMPGSGPSRPGSGPSLPGSGPSLHGSRPSLPGSSPSFPGSTGGPQALSVSGTGARSSTGGGGTDVAWEREWEQIDRLCEGWVASGKAGAKLLRGAKLQHARQWLAQGRGKYPAPKPVHQQFIVAGTRAARARSLGVVALVVLLLGGLGGGAWYLYGGGTPNEIDDDGTEVAVLDAGGGTPESNVEVRRGDRRGSDELAGKAEGLLGVDPVLAVLLATEAVSWLPEDQPAVDTPAYRVLGEALQRLPGRPLRGHSASIEAVAISLDGRWAVTSERGREGVVRLWDLDVPGVLRAANLRGHANAVTAMEISRDGHWLVTADADGLAFRWNLRDADPASSSARLEGHRASIGAVDLSADGRWLVTGDDGGRVNVWNLDQPVPGPIRLPKGPEAKVTGVAINDFGTRVLASSEDMTARNWRLDEGKASKPLVIPHGDEENPVTVTAVGLAGNDSAALTGTSDGTVFLWDPTSRAPARKWEPLVGHTRAVTHIELSVDSSVAVSAAQDNALIVWDLTAKVVSSSSIKLPGHTEPILGLQLFSTPADIPAGRHAPMTAFSASADGTARSWNLDKRFSGIESRVFAGHSGGVRSVSVSGDGQWVVTGGQGGLARVWDWQSLPPSTDGPTADLPPVGSASIVARGHAASVVAVAVDDFGRRMLTGSADGTARVWDLRNPVRVHGLPMQDFHRAPVRAAAVSIDPRFGATGDDSGQLVLWTISTDEPQGQVLAGHSSEIGALAFTPDGRRLVSASTDSTARIWRIEQGKVDEQTAIVLPHSDEITQLAISEDGDLLLTGTLTKAVLWKLSAIDPNAPVRIFSKHESDITAVALGPRGRWAATGSDDQRAMLYDLSKKRPTEYVLRGHADTVRVLAFSPTPSPKYLATGSDDKSIRLWNLQSEHPDEGSIVLSDHEGGINDLAWSPDGRWLISASNDGTIRLWDTRKEVAQMIDDAVVLRGHQGVVKRVRMVAGEDGLRSLVSAGYDGTARMWPLERDPLVKLGCTAAGRRLTEEEWKELVGGDYDTSCG
ncbi:MAG: FHA domain-containing protein [Nannocystaceae bacterium]